MKIALVSDLHLEFRQEWEIEHLHNKLWNLNVEILFNAGDTHPNQLRRQQFLQFMPKNYLTCLGNHDYYDNQPKIGHERRFVTIGGLKICCCTLWTNFKNEDPILIERYPLTLYDAKRIIHDDLANKVLEIHKGDMEFIAKHDPDIVMTHHAPSYESVHWWYRKTGDINYYFCSDLDEFIKQSNIKYWFHGHVHNAFDYMIGNCRIICNPLGYPHENPSVKSYKPKVINV